MRPDLVESPHRHQRSLLDQSEHVEYTLTNLPASAKTAATPGTNVVIFLQYFLAWKWK